jgi:hypothetical protein
MRYVSKNAGHNLRVRLIRELYAGIWEAECLEQSKTFRLRQIITIHESDLKNDE